MARFSSMGGVTEPTVDDLPAETDALQAVELRLDGIPDDDLREPHRHAYHELIWVRDGQGRHLIDGEPVEFGPRTLTLIAKGQVHQFQQADDVSGVVVRFDDDWLSGSRRWLFSGGSCTALSVPPDEAPPFEALVDLLRAEIERPAGTRVRRAAQPSARVGAPLGAALAGGAAGGPRRERLGRGAPPRVPGAARARLRHEPRRRPLRRRARHHHGHPVAHCSRG